MGQSNKHVANSEGFRLMTRDRGLTKRVISAAHGSVMHTSDPSYRDDIWAGYTARDDDFLESAFMAIGYLLSQGGEAAVQKLTARPNPQQNRDAFVRFSKDEELTIRTVQLVADYATAGYVIEARLWSKLVAQDQEMLMTLLLAVARGIQAIDEQKKGAVDRSEERKGDAPAETADEGDRSDDEPEADSPGTARGLSGAGAPPFAPTPSAAPSTSE